MTIEKMRNKIKEECNKNVAKDKFYCSDKCPLRNRKNCYCYTYETNEEIKENYELMFGKEESKIEMKNEFDFNELKAGYAIKVPKFENQLLVAIPSYSGIVFYNNNWHSIVSKENILNENISDEYKPIEIYDVSCNYNLFSEETRKLIWKKEYKNFKKYEIGDLIISPNSEKYGYKIKEENEINGFIYIKSKNSFGNFGNINIGNGISIHKKYLNDVINVLMEIKTFIEEDK